MMQTLLSPSALALINEIKGWVTLIGLAYGAFKGYRWVKDLREKDIPDLKAGINAVAANSDKLHNEMKDQTTAVVKELSELRADMRTYYSPKIRAAAARRRKK